MKQKPLYLLVELISSVVIILISYAIFVYGNIKLGSDAPTKHSNYISNNIDSPNPEIIPITPNSFLKMQDTFSTITVVNFWASKSLSCKKEIPLLRQFCMNKGYQLIYINAETNTESKKKNLWAGMANFGILRSYSITNNDSTAQSNEEVLRHFLKDINILNYKGGSQFVVIYNPHKKTKSTYQSFDIQEAFDKFMENKINIVKPLK